MADLRKSGLRDELAHPQLRALLGYCHRPAPDVATAAKSARAGLEALLDLLEWPEDVALSRAIDRLVQFEERQG